MQNGTASNYLGCSQIFLPTPGLLLGAVVSSTDAAAVFSVLRSKSISLHGRVKPMLELESGSNDPTAVLLTIGIIQIITNPETSLKSIAPLFVVQMGLGIVFGLGFGMAMVFLLNRTQAGVRGTREVMTSDRRPATSDR